MLVKRLKHNQINKTKWDQAISASSSPKIYALSWFLDIVSPEWQALIFEDYTCIMPLPVNYKMGFPRYLQPIFSQQLGVFSNPQLDETSLINFLKHIPRNIKTDLHFYHNIPHKKTQKRANYVLDLSLNYKDLKANYSKNTLRNIKKGQNSTFQITSQGKYDKIIQCFKDTKGKTLRLNSKYYKTLETLIIQAQKRNAAHVYTCEIDATFVCGVVLFSFLDRLYFLFSATSALAKSTSAMPYLIDHIIKTHAESRRYLDFEGSDNENLARFYSGFGGKNEPYYRYQCSFFGGM